MYTQLEQLSWREAEALMHVSASILDPVMQVVLLSSSWVLHNAGQLHEQDGLADQLSE